MKLDTIIQSAILGSGNVPLPEEINSFYQAQGIQKPETPEVALLLAGLLCSRMELAGAIPAVSNRELQVSPAEGKEYCGARAMYFLTLFLNGSMSNLLPEFLSAIREAGKIVRPEVLPELLEAGTRKRSLRKLILQTGGERLGWLGGLFLEWRWAVGEMEAGWEALAPDQRAAWLEDTFADRPADILRQIGETWKGETPELRKRVCEIISGHKTPEVEAFLEFALSDSRKEVREAAAAGLAGFSQGRVSQEIGALFTQWVSYQKKLFKTTFVVEIPESLPDGFADLGIDKKGSVVEGGEKANWLAVVASRTQPAHWRQVFGDSLKSALQTIQDSDWSLSLTYGWVQVAAQSQDWEMVDLAVTRERFKESPHTLDPILSRLNPETLSKLVLKFEGAGAAGLRTDGLPIVRLINGSSCAILPETANRLLHLLRVFVREPGDYSVTYAIQSMLESLALRFPPDLADAAATSWPENSEGWGHWEKHVLKFLSTLRNRSEMLKSILEKS